MSDLLREAVEQLAKALPESEQNALGARLLSALAADERDGAKALRVTAERLEELAEHILARNQVGDTGVLASKSTGTTRRKAAV
jgi:hypothetical protein